MALGYREQHGLDLRHCRLSWSESDASPGLIVDRYGDHLVVETLTLAMDLRKSAEECDREGAPGGVSTALDCGTDCGGERFADPEGGGDGVGNRRALGR